MCAKCWDAVSKAYPDATEAERVSLLWETTSFPFGSPEEIATQLTKQKEPMP